MTAYSSKFGIPNFPINMNLQRGMESPAGSGKFQYLPEFEFAIRDRQVYDYNWIYVMTCILGFTLAMANGANDVANSFATSVGSRALKMWHAILIASFCEFGGAYLLGARVTGTIRSGIASTTAFKGHDDLFMVGMMVACFTVTLWIGVMTAFGIPVSITHSIVGSIIGFSICSPVGTGSVNWTSFGLIVLSWIASPGVSAILGGSFFAFNRKFILRNENSTDRALKVFPIIGAFTVWVNVCFIVFKGGIASGSGYAGGKKLSDGESFAIAFGCAGGAGIILAGVVYKLRQHIMSFSEEELVAMALVRGNITLDDEMKAKAKGEAGSALLLKDVFAPKNYSLLDRMLHQPEVDAAAFASEKIVSIHENAEVFNVRTELAYSYLQIFTACFASFAHGSNDVANSVGPISAVVAVYLNGPGSVQKNVDVPDWCLLIGCAGLVVGLVLFGHRVIATMGNNLIKITPSRGFSAELTFAFVIVFGSFLGIPLSTTHSIVGAIVGVGIAEGKIRESVNWNFFGIVFFSWVMTVCITITLSAATFSLLTFSPSQIYPLSKHNCIHFYGAVKNVTKGDPSQYTVDVLNGTVSGLVGYPVDGRVVRL